MKNLNVLNITGIILMVMGWLVGAFVIKEFTSTIYFVMTLGLFFVILGIIKNNKQSKK